MVQDGDKFYMTAYFVSPGKHNCQANFCYWIFLKLSFFIWNSKTLFFPKMQTDSICTHGRTAGQFSSQGTGTDLYIQNSTDPMASIRIPHQESAIGSTAWVKGHCFPAMGKCMLQFIFHISIFIFGSDTYYLLTLFNWLTKISMR